MIKIRIISAPYGAWQAALRIARARGHWSTGRIPIASWFFRALGLAVPGFIGLRLGAGFLGSGVCGFN